MSVDHIRYDLMVRDALRGVVRRVVSDVAKNGLPGDHHFYISFDTRAVGVRLSPRLRAQYPEEMTIVLQHQFWDLAVTDAGIEVGLSFGGVPEKLLVPFEAIKGFFDPSVQFGLEFETGAEKRGDALPEGRAPTAPIAQSNNEAGPKGPAVAHKRLSRRIKDPGPGAAERAADAPPAGDGDEPPKPTGGAEVVKLDRFRKK